MGGTGSLAAWPSGILARMIEMRVLTPDDWPLWRALRHAALAEAPYAFGSTLADWQGDGDREARWRARLEPPSHNVITFLGGEPVGMASGMPAEDDGVAELISMWVSPTGRGRGVGDALVQEVVRWARSVGSVAVRLDVSDGNDAAARLYRRNGFAYTGELGDFMADGVRRERVMTKPLVG